jgi:hypothetical protein
MLVVLATATPARAGTFIDTAWAPFGTFGGIDYVRYTGRFVGSTALGLYRMPFEIVAPVDPVLGNRSVLIEPPHFAFGLPGREGVLGRALLFGHGFSYASVGYGTLGLNRARSDCARPRAGRLPVSELGLAPVVDYEILVQFVHALDSEPFAVDALGAIERKYGYGVSQIAQAWLVVFSISRPGSTSSISPCSTALSGGRPSRHPTCWSCCRKNFCRWRALAR